MRVALAQIEVEAAARADNLDRARAAIDEAAADGADLVVLPELFAVGYFAFDSYGRSAESVAGPTLSGLRDHAVDAGVALLAGTVVEDLAATAAGTDVPVPAAEGLANTAVLFDADGRRRLVYRKHHLFGYESAESRLLTAGERVPTADLGDLRVGVTTCYDLRFPSLYRRLVAEGVQAVLVPSAWPYPRVEHWRLLPRARAVENLAYVAAANGAGTVVDTTLVGRSAVYGPWGTTRAGAGESPEVVTADLDPDRVEAVRAEFPALADRRDLE